MRVRGRGARVTAMFTPPTAPEWHGSLAYRHTHDLVEIGARRNGNGTWSSLWGCRLCPDVIIGDYVGPVPAGWCRCGWVQKRWPRKRCEECQRPMVERGS